MNWRRPKACLTLYQLKTRTAKLYLCSRSGIYTHQQRRFNPHLHRFNVAYQECVNSLKIADVPTYNGVNYPADRAQ